MSESEIHAALSVDNVRAHVEYLTENLPTRLGRLGEWRPGRRI